MYLLIEKNRADEAPFFGRSTSNSACCYERPLLRNSKKDVTKCTVSLPSAVVLYV